MGTGVALFIYKTNFGLARLELKWLWMLRRSLPEMVQRVSKTKPILSSPEPALSQGERRHVGTVRKRKFGVPRFVAGNICGNGVKLGVRVSPPYNSTSSVHHPGLIRAEQEQDTKGQNTTKLGI